MKKTVTVILFLLLATSASGQQQRRTPQPTPPPVAEPAPEAPPPTYEPELLRLAEILGGLSYLSNLCTHSNADSWELRMTQLLEAEGTTTTRKERLAGAFNRGFLGYQPAHRICSESSRLSIESLIDKGHKITSEIARRYGG